MKYNKVEIIKIILAILLTGCLFDVPYEYFQFIKTIGLISFVFLAYYANNEGNKEWALFWGLCAIIINPIFKISLGRTIWNIVDVIWAVILIYSLVVSKKEMIRSKK